MSLKNKLDNLFMSVKIGVPVRTANDGKPIEQITILYKSYYLFVDFDAESGKPTGDFGWSEDPTMNPTAPIRNILVAKEKVSSK